MSVTRFDVAVFHSEKIRMAEHVMTVLKAYSEYKNAQELTDSEIRVTVKPSFYLLPTEMSIKLVEKEGKTAIRVSTKSQGFIMGDAFGYYDRYIREFLARLRYLEFQKSNT